MPVRQILAEWARVGGTKVVGADKITGAPLTLHIVNMPERQALDIILRNVAGFMAAPRLASAAPGVSAYDRILIMATSSAPAPAPAAANGRRHQQRAGTPPAAASAKSSAVSSRRHGRRTGEQVVNEDPADTGRESAAGLHVPAAERERRDAGVPAGADGPAVRAPRPAGFGDADDHAAAERERPAGHLQLRSQRPDRTRRRSTRRSRVAVQRDRLTSAGDDSAGSPAPASTRTAAARATVGTRGPRAIAFLHGPTLAGGRRLPTDSRMPDIEPYRSRRSAWRRAAVSADVRHPGSRRGSSEMGLGAAQSRQSGRRTVPLDRPRRAHRHRRMSADARTRQYSRPRRRGRMVAPIRSSSPSGSGRDSARRCCARGIGSRASRSAQACLTERAISSRRFTGRSRSHCPAS